AGVGTGGAAFAAGLLPLVYLPWRAGQTAMTDWQYPATLASFWQLVSAEPYHYLLFHRPLPEIVGNGALWLETLAVGLGLISAPVALLGLGRLWRQRRAWAITSGLIVLANGGYTLIYG